MDPRSPLHQEDVIAGEGKIDRLIQQEDVPRFGEITRMPIIGQRHDDDGKRNDKAGRVGNPAHHVDRAAAIALPHNQRLPPADRVVDSLQDPD